MTLSIITIITMIYRKKTQNKVIEHNEIQHKET
jgi:hypothetical protein